MDATLQTTEKTLTVGAWFCDALRKQGMTESQLQSELRLQPKYLQALLHDDFAALPGRYYARHVVRLAAKTLKLSPDQAEAMWREQMAHDVLDEAPERAFDRQKIRRGSLLSVGRVATASLVACALFLLLLYFGTNIRHALLPPSLALLSPQGDLVVNDRALIVKGKTEPEVSLKINGHLVALDSAGVFSTPLYLDDGLNIIEIRAAKRYSGDQVMYRRVFVESGRGAVGLK